jgi:hypothetical protein
MRLLHFGAALLLLTLAGCHPGPVIGSGPQPPGLGGTIAGIVSMEGNVPVVGRKVTATEAGSGQHYDATTGANGGYTIKVPQGSYRLDVELRPGERIVKRPGETRIDKSDLDAKRDFLLSGGA